MKLLALDMGASSGRGIVADLDGGRLTLEEVHRFENGMIERDGHRHWDVPRLRGELLTALRKAGPDVASAGIETWGVDYGYFDRDGELIGLPFGYRDERTGPMIDAVHALVGEEHLFDISGLQVVPINTIYQLADDVASRPEVLEQAHRFQMMPELFGFLLTGEHVSEYSIASTSGLLDAKARTWSDELIDKLRLPRRLFGEIAHPGERSAPLRQDVAEATGSRAELITVAGHDTACAVAATPMTSEGAMYISSGTWSLVGVELPEPVLTPEARAGNFTNEGGVNRTIRFLKNVMGLWLVQELRRLWAEGGNALDHGAVCDAAAEAPPFAALVDPNRRLFFAPEDMRAALREECRRTGQAAPEGVGPSARCVFESLALAYRECLETIQHLTGRTIDCVHVVGGGVQNRLLCQMTADACGVPVYAGPVEATAVGNVLIQAIALGAVADVAAGREIVRAAFPLDEYAPKDRAAWEKAWERYQGLPG